MPRKKGNLKARQTPRADSLLRSPNFRVTSRQMKAAGITRVTEVTGMDILGIPVFTAIRPNRERDTVETISVYNGKGLTKSTARLGAVMEAVERFCGDRAEWSRKVRVRSEKEFLKLGVNFVSPRGLPLRGRVSYRTSMPVEWVAGRDLFAAKNVWVPACAVYSPYEAESGQPLPGAGSDGLASGFSMASAVISAILELVERHALSAAERSGRSVNVDLSRCREASLRRLHRRFQAQGIALVVKDVTGPTGIPTFVASCDDPHTGNVMLLNRGQAAHWDPLVAMTKAVLEAAQGRLTVIQGAREDLASQEKSLRRYGYDRLRRREFSFYFRTDGETRPVNDYRHVSFSSLRQAERYVLEGLRRAGYERAVAVNLTHSNVEIPVVKIVVPGMKPWQD